MTNIYDDEYFFEQYSNMSRSVDGLKGAGEWHVFKELLPDLNGLNVLDFGCGYGWHAKYAVDHGAQHVTAVDQSEKMIDTARHKNPAPQIDYQVGDITLFNGQEECFDVVLSSLVFHYIEDIETLFQSVYRMLQLGGTFLFTVEHPLFTAEGSQNWVYDDNGRPKYFPVDHYFHEGVREAEFLGVNVKKFHHTIESYMRALLSNGFHIQDVREPGPPEEMMHIEGMKDELRRPMMLMIKAEK